MKKTSANSNRRRFLAWLTLLTGGLLAATPARQNRPRELALKEADFYAPHDHAG